MKTCPSGGIPPLAKLILINLATTKESVIVISQSRKDHSVQMMKGMCFGTMRLGSDKKRNDRDAVQFALMYNITRATTSAGAAASAQKRLSPICVRPRAGMLSIIYRPYNTFHCYIAIEFFNVHVIS
jgi:hypothetical protein